MKIKVVGLVLWLVFGLLWGQRASAANVLVGDGTPASCNEAAFDNALAAAQSDLGGVITFNCGDATHTIDIYTTSVIYTQVEIDGGDKIRLFAQGSAPLFVKSRFFAVNPGGWLTLRNITLEGARSPAGDGWGSQGGSIVVWGSADPEERTGLELFSTIILNSASTAWGGAIANEGASVRIENSLITGSSAKWGGGYSGANGADAFINSTVTASTSEQGGGGVRFWNSLNSQISDGSVISGNSTTGAGGGIENVGGVVAIRGSYIENNSATQWGGGVKNSNNDSRVATILVENSRISGNSSDANGGGVDSNGTLSLQDTRVSGNSAAGFGGGILHWGGQLRLIGVTVTDNQANAGGGLYANGGGALIDRATISDNRAVEGAGLFLTEIAGANAENWVTITATGITGNKATTGAGGIVASRAYVTLHNTEVSGNSWGVYLSPTASGGSYVVVTQSSVHNNTGGGFFNGAQGTLLLGNTTVSQNSGWGVWVGQDSIYTQLKFSTVRGNTTGQVQRTGGQLALEAVAIDAGGAPVANCVAAGGLPVVSSLDSWSSDASCGQPIRVSSNFNLGPLDLNGGTTPNHMPQAGSVLIDAANDCSGYALDQRGANRPSGAKCDVGAAEYGAVMTQEIYLPMVVR